MMYTSWLKNSCRVLLALTCLAMGAVSAADLAYGKLLHDTEYLFCHNATHYTRENRLVDSLDKLRKRDAYCRDDVGVEWDAAETDGVVQYLNSYYNI